MADFDLNSIGEALANGGLSAIGKRTKVKQADIAKVLSEGIPSLLQGMQTNASTEEGAASLCKALESHSKDDISDVKTFLKGADLEDGKKILGHVFGERQTETIQQLSADTGVSEGKTRSILSMVAPLLLSQLGGQQQQAQSSGGGFNVLSLLRGLLGGGNGGGTASLASGLLGSLLGGSNNNSGGILNTILNLFH